MSHGTYATRGSKTSKPHKSAFDKKIEEVIDAFKFLTPSINKVFNEFNLRRNQPYKHFGLRGYKPGLWPAKVANDNVERLNSCLYKTDQKFKDFYAAYKHFNLVREKNQESIKAKILYDLFHTLYDAFEQMKTDLKELKGECRGFTRLQSLVTEKQFGFDDLLSDLLMQKHKITKAERDKELSEEAKQLIRQIEDEVMLKYTLPEIPSHTPRGGGRRRTRRRGASRRSKTLRGRR